MAKFYTKEEIEFLKENAPKFGVKICAEKLNKSEHSVYAKLNRLSIKPGIDPNITQKDIDNLIFESSFKELNINFNITKFPKETAYFMGFFWADGYIKNKELTIEIIEEDGKVLEPIFDRIATFSKYYRSREGRKPQMTFRFNSDEVAKLFISLGKYPKSTESHEKILKYIPKEYHVYFLRGLIDGDGCWYYNEHNTQFSITSSLNSDWSFLVNYLKENLNFNCSTSIQSNTISTSNSSSKIRNSHPSEIYNFIRYLYKIKDGIWLERKYQKTQYILKNENGNC